MPVAGCLTLSDAEAKTANAGIAPRIKDVCLMPITALYAALLTALFVALSVRVVAARRGSGAALGDGGNPDLLRRIRVQGNFAEYVPLALILSGLAEGLHTSVWLLHLLGLRLADRSPAARLRRLANQRAIRVSSNWPGTHALHVNLRCIDLLSYSGAALAWSSG